jgi:hypothetical protein
LGCDIVIDMKTISVGVSEEDYEAFREAAMLGDRSIAQLIREAMALYREERLSRRTPLRRLRVLAGHRPVGSLPPRHEVYDEIHGERWSSS